MSRTCILCKVTAQSDIAWSAHLTGKRHIKNVKLAGFDPTISENSSNNDGTGNDTNEGNIELRHRDGLRHGSSSSAGLFEEADEDDKTKAELSPRVYQLEILEAAVQQNTLAFLDTGSGKTFIAVMLIKIRLASMRKRHIMRLKNGVTELAGKLPRKSIIAFVAPTRLLLEQQKVYISANCDCSVKCYLGGDMGSRRLNPELFIDEIKAVDIVMMTPELLKHMLQQNIFQPSNIDTLIFDECHHAIGKSAMSACCKLIQTEPFPNRPSIFGMTASPIAGKKGDLARKIKELETTLDCKLVRPKGKLSMMELDTMIPKPSFAVLEYRTNNSWQRRGERLFVSAQVPEKAASSNQGDDGHKVDQAIVDRIKQIASLGLPVTPWDDTINYSTTAQDVDSGSTQVKFELCTEPIALSIEPTSVSSSCASSIESSAGAAAHGSWIPPSPGASPALDSALNADDEEVVEDLDDTKLSCDQIFSTLGYDPRLFWNTSGVLMQLGSLQVIFHGYKRLRFALYVHSIQRLLRDLNILASELPQLDGLDLSYFDKTLPSESLRQKRKRSDENGVVSTHRRTPYAKDQKVRSDLMTEDDELEDKAMLVDVNPVSLDTAASTDTQGMKTASGPSAQIEEIDHDGNNLDADVDMDEADDDSNIKTESKVRGDDGAGRDRKEWKRRRSPRQNSSEMLPRQRSKTISDLVQAYGQIIRILSDCGLLCALEALKISAFGWHKSVAAEDQQIALLSSSLWWGRSNRRATVDLSRVEGMKDEILSGPFSMANLSAASICSCYSLLDCFACLAAGLGPNLCAKAVNLMLAEKLFPEVVLVADILQGIAQQAAIMEIVCGSDGVFAALTESRGHGSSLSGRQSEDFSSGSIMELTNLRLRLVCQAIYKGCSVLSSLVSPTNLVTMILLPTVDSTMRYFDVHKPNLVSSRSDPGVESDYQEQNAEVDSCSTQAIRRSDHTSLEGTGYSMTLSDQNAQDNASPRSGVDSSMVQGGLSSLATDDLISESQILGTDNEFGLVTVKVQALFRYMLWIGHPLLVAKRYQLAAKSKRNQSSRLAKIMEVFTELRDPSTAQLCAGHPINDNFEDWSAIIFCRMKLSAVTLSLLLTRFLESLDCLISFDNSPGLTPALASEIPPKPLWRRLRAKALIGGNKQVEQVSTLLAFKRGDFNVLFATDVAEEGIHVRACKLVINFDSPPTVKSYIQRRGRARATESLMISLTPRVVNGSPVLMELAAFASQEGVMRDMSKSLSVELLLDTKSIAERSDELDLHPSRIDGAAMALHASEMDLVDEEANDSSIFNAAEFYTTPAGVSVSSVDVLSLLHEYCLSLPQDDFYHPTEIYWVESVSKATRAKWNEKAGLGDEYSDALVAALRSNRLVYQCSVLLPSAAPPSIRCSVGPPAISKTSAKRLAVINCLIELHKAQEVDDYFHTRFLIPKAAVGSKSSNQKGDAHGTRPVEISKLSEECSDSTEIVREMVYATPSFALVPLSQPVQQQDSVNRFSSSQRTVDELIDVWIYRFVVNNVALNVPESLETCTRTGDLMSASRDLLARRQEDFESHGFKWVMRTLDTIGFVTTTRLPEVLLNDIPELVFKGTVDISIRVELICQRRISRIMLKLLRQFHQSILHRQQADPDVNENIMSSGLQDISGPLFSSVSSNDTEALDWCTVFRFRNEFNIANEGDDDAWTAAITEDLTGTEQLRLNCTEYRRRAATVNLDLSSLNCLAEQTRASVDTSAYVNADLAASSCNSLVAPSTSSTNDTSSQSNDMGNNTEGIGSRKRALSSTLDSPHDLSIDIFSSEQFCGIDSQVVDPSDAIRVPHYRQVASVFVRELTPKLDSNGPVTFKSDSLKDAGSSVGRRRLIQLPNAAGDLLDSVFGSQFTPSQLFVGIPNIDGQAVTLRDVFYVKAPAKQGVAIAASVEGNEVGDNKKSDIHDQSAQQQSGSASSRPLVPRRYLDHFLMKSVVPGNDLNKLADKSGHMMVCAMNVSPSRAFIHLIPRFRQDVEGELNFSDSTSKSDANSLAAASKEMISHLIPEYCVRLGDAKWHYLGLVAPSLIWRLQSMVMAYELRETIVNRNRIDVNAITDNTVKVDESIVPSDGLKADAVCIHSRNEIAPEMCLPPLRTLLEAMTPRLTIDNMNLDRLEWLGDSVLKFLVTVEIFHLFPSDHEGRLTNRRGAIISNNNLISVARTSGMSPFIRILQLCDGYQSLFRLFPGTLVPCDANCHYSPNDAPIHHICRRVVQLSVRAKSLADLVESVIGSYFVHGGFPAAMYLFQQIGIIGSFSSPCLTRYQDSIVSTTLTPSSKNNWIDSIREADVAPTLPGQLVVPDNYPPILARIAIGPEFFRLSAQDSESSTKSAAPNETIEPNPSGSVPVDSAMECEEDFHVLGHAPMFLDPDVQPPAIVASECTTGVESTESSKIKKGASLQDIMLEDAAHIMCEKIGYMFRQPAILDEALTHCSVQHKVNNQRLEYLGDAVLDMVIAKQLYYNGQDLDQGELSMKKSSLVRNHNLAKVAIKLQLYKNLQVMSAALRSEFYDLELWNAMRTATDESAEASESRRLDDAGEADETILRPEASIVDPSSAETIIRVDHLADISSSTTGQLPSDPTQAVSAQGCGALADLVEAIIGAVYIDSEGDLDAAALVVHKMGILRDGE